MGLHTRVGEYRNRRRESNRRESNRRRESEVEVRSSGAMQPESGPERLGKEDKSWRNLMG